MISRLSIKSKLSLLIAFSIACLSLVGIGGWAGSSKINTALASISTEKLPAAEALSTIRSRTALIHSLCLEAALWRPLEYQQTRYQSIQARLAPAFSELKGAVSSFDALPRSEDESKAWESVKKRLTSWMDYANKTAQVIADLGQTADPDKKEELFGDYDIFGPEWAYMQADLQTDLTALTVASFKSSDVARQAADTAQRGATTFLIGAYAIAVLTLLMLGLLIFRSINSALRILRDSIVKVERNSDFTIRANVTTRDETRQTADAFNSLVVRLQQSLSDVLSQIGEISNAAHSTSTIAQEVSDASEIQSESSSAMASTIEEMSVSISNISELTKDALHRSHEMQKSACTGAEQISQLNSEIDQISRTVADAEKTVAELDTQSDRISLVVKVIKEIAEQTNLLALNAAIEAARAGEQGRGFAVVADEVRKLSERTTRSTTEIADVVRSMQLHSTNVATGMKTVVSSVDKGRVLSDMVSGKVREIDSNSQRATEAVEEICSAMIEQHRASESIASKIETIAQVGETNMRSSKETARLAHEIDDLSHKLRLLAGQFVV